MPCAIARLAEAVAPGVEARRLRARLGARGGSGHRRGAPLQRRVRPGAAADGERDDKGGGDGNPAQGLPPARSAGFPPMLLGGGPKGSTRASGERRCGKSVSAIGGRIDGRHVGQARCEIARPSARTATFSRNRSRRPAECGRMRDEAARRYRCVAVLLDFPERWLTNRFPEWRRRGKARMGLRFRQSFQLFPGVRINISKSGISTSLGLSRRHSQPRSPRHDYHPRHPRIGSIILDPHPHCANRQPAATPALQPFERIEPEPETSSLNQPSVWFPAAWHASDRERIGRELD